ncbi:hypothetical protein BIV57_18200 [Mangrovactinospora gilvigrisea]|uniref:Major facilitator superfamily (MFS) profile domain-containing protein n=1 Tax=Mangrovactinospora gilvigrisea TaxID=1428644 RepID=A0A1J7BBU3_9ACTN|nr:hypothetical protein BIV57_18200 [Mangrovactinospora gilvigrisea]
MALAVVSAASALDTAGFAVANTAMPEIGRQLGMGAAALPWIMTVYALAFGGFLLFGGRAADVLGRRRMLLAGLLVFAGGSALAAAAPTAGLLIGGRALQGLGAALSGPPALALIASIFPEGRERARAMGIYVAISASSFAGALVFGGLLTSAAGWRATFVALLAVAALATVVGARVLPSGGARTRGSLDIPGAALITAGLMALVYGVTQAEGAGFAAPAVLLPLAAAVLLLAGFVVRERTAAQPLMPPALLRVRTVRAATVAGVLFYATMVGLLFFAPLYLQGLRGWSPIESGLAVAPMGVTVAATTGLSARILGRLGRRGTLVLGFTTMALGLGGWLLVGLHTPYPAVMLPAIVVQSFGQTLAYTAMMDAALAGVPGERHGVAGAVNITAQQIGSGLGTAILALVAASAGTAGRAGTLAGYHAGTATAIGFGVAAAVLVPLLLPRGRR